MLQPAIELGENGFPVSPITASYWGRGAKQLKEQGGSGIKALLQPDGTAPKAGQLQKNAHLAATFKSLAEHGAEKGEAVTLLLEEQEPSLFFLLSYTFFGFFCNYCAS